MLMINEIELQAVSTMGAFDRYRYFIKRIAGQQEIWVLEDKRNNYAISEVDGNLLFSFWSDREFTYSCWNNEWKNYTPVNLNLEQLESDIFPIIERNNYLMDIFPVNNLAGFVVTLDEFLHDLNNELENYE